jgi:hypothetical protein
MESNRNRIRQDFGPDGPGANDMRAALEYLCTPQGSAKTNSEVSGSYQPPGVASWSVGKIVSGKYVMIIDVIVDEQEGLDTVTMVSSGAYSAPPLIFAYAERLLNEGERSRSCNHLKKHLRMMSSTGRHRSDRGMHWCHHQIPHLRESPQDRARSLPRVGRVSLSSPRLANTHCLPRGLFGCVATR